MLLDDYGSALHSEQQKAFDHFALGSRRSGSRFADRSRTDFQEWRNMNFAVVSEVIGGTFNGSPIWRLLCQLGSRPALRKRLVC